MNTLRTTKTILLSFLILLGSFGVVMGQVWPGDANNNGIVNGVDWLYIGYAIGETGPARDLPELGIEWEEKTVSTFWGLDFPGLSVDLAYADCDGDGVVSFFDFDAIYANFLLTHGVVDDEVGIAGVPGVDDQLSLIGAPENATAQGSVVLMELQLGSMDNPVDAFSGVTFDLEFDPDIIADVFFFPIGEDIEGWGQYDLHVFQNTDPDAGRTTLSFATSGMQLIENTSGILGQLFIVIEDDVVDYQGGEEETIVSLENIILFGNGLSQLPAVNDSVSITIVEDPLSTSEPLDPSLVKLFPNPAKDWVYLESDLDINRVEVFNTLGQRITIETMDLVNRN